MIDRIPLGIEIIAHTLLTSWSRDDIVSGAIQNTALIFPLEFNLADAGVLAL